MSELCTHSLQKYDFWAKCTLPEDHEGEHEGIVKWATTAEDEKSEKERIANQLWRTKNPEVMRNWKKNNPEKVKLYRARRSKKHREKLLAMSAVKNALRSGKIIKPFRCSKCRKVTNSRLLDAHHEDYAKRLEVIWLCRRCHIDIHRPAAAARAAAALATLEGRDGR